jgi:hypothetical protein
MTGERESPRRQHSHFYLGRKALCLGILKKKGGHKPPFSWSHFLRMMAPLNFVERYPLIGGG